MKFAIAEKSHEKYIAEVVTAISQDSFWREKVVHGQYDEEFLITYKELEELPCSLWTVFSKYGLEFFVSKVEAIAETFIPGQVIFKFQAKDFPDIVRYAKGDQ